MSTSSHHKFILIGFAVGIVAALMAFLLYQFIKFDGYSLASQRTDDGVCLKQMRVVQLVTSSTLKPEKGEALANPLCDSAANTSIRAKLVFMTGDTYEVKCASPGFPASQQPVTVFYWDKGVEYGETITLRKHASADGGVSTPQCKKYGLRMIE